MKPGLKKTLKILVLALSFLYAIHPLVLTPVARALARKHWHGRSRIGWVFVTPLGTLAASRVTLEYPEGYAWKPFVDVKKLRVRLSAARTAAGAWRLVPVEASCRSMALVLTREAIRFASDRPAGQPPAGGNLLPLSVRLSCERGALAVDPPEGVSISGGAARGLFLFSPAERRLALDFTATHPQWGEGHVSCEADLARHAAVWRFHAPAATVDAGVLPMLPPPVRARFTELSPEGTARFQMTLTNLRGSPPATEGRIVFSGRAIRLPPPCPLPLENPRGEYVWGPQGHEIREFHASFAGTSLVADGRIDPAAGKFHGVIRTGEAPLPPELYPFLPPRLAKTWDFLGPAGTLTLDVGVSGHFHESVRASTTFHAVMKEASLAALAPPATGLTGTLDLELLGRGDTLHGEGEARLASARVGPVPLDHVRIPLFIGSGEDGRTVSLGLPDLPFEAGCAGGITRGHVRFQEAPLPTATIDVSGHDIRIEKLLVDILGSSRDISGKLEHALHLERSADGWRGTGSIDIRDGDLGKLPTLTGIVERLLGKEKVDAARIRRVEAEFRVHPQKLVVTHLKVHGKNLALYAADGEIRRDGRIDFTFYAGARHHLLENVPILNEIWQLATGVLTGLASVRVTGTWKEPAYELAPLRAPVKSITGILEGLVGNEE